MKPQGPLLPLLLRCLSSDVPLPYIDVHLLCSSPFPCTPCYYVGRCSSVSTFFHDNCLSVSMSFSLVSHLASSFSRFPLDDFFPTFSSRLALVDCERPRHAAHLAGRSCTSVADRSQRDVFSRAWACPFPAILPMNGKASGEPRPRRELRGAQRATWGL